MPIATINAVLTVTPHDLIQILRGKVTTSLLMIRHHSG